MLAICRHFNRVIENYRGEQRNDRDEQRNDRDEQRNDRDEQRNRNHQWRILLRLFATTELEQVSMRHLVSIEILQLQSDDAFAVRFLLNCAVALMTATAEFQ